jgi:hypothetical protein
MVMTVAGVKDEPTGVWIIRITAITDDQTDGKLFLLIAGAVDWLGAAKMR